MTNQTELLPCPFCGGAADAPHDPAGMLFDSSIQCSVCLASGPCPDPGQSHAECWNTRAAPAEDVRAVGEEPVAYVMPMQIEAMKSVGWMHASRDKGHTGLEVGLYRHPQRPVVMPERRQDLSILLGENHDQFMKGQDVG